jgi:hypothetical protein
MKLFVAIPVYRDMPAEFVISLMSLVQDLKPLVKFCHGDGLVCRSRNRLSTDFLETDCTHCLFMDCDGIFRTEDVTRLTSHDKAIVGGFVALKQEGSPRWACTFLRNLPPPDERGLQPLLHIGSGFLCIRRDVFERMVAVHGPEISYSDPYTGRLENNFWSPTVNQGCYLSEDYSFCERARSLGFGIYGDCRVLLRHVGTAIFPLVKNLSPNRGGLLPTDGETL